MKIIILKKNVAVTILSFSIIILSADLAECKKNLGVGKEMLQPILADQYSYIVEPQILWEVIDSIVGHNFNTQILARDPESFIISWTEHFNKEIMKFKNQDNSEVIKKLTESEITEVGEDGTAITTIYVNPLGNNGSRMRIRRVYYGKLTQPKMVYSRGNFANYFQKLVNQEFINRGILGASL